MVLVQTESCMYAQVNLAIFVMLLVLVKCMLDVGCSLTNASTI